MTNHESPNWDRIVDQHAKGVFRVAFRILGSVQDAEDVSQDVFAEAFRVHSRGPVQTWAGLLVRLATLRSLDRLRRNRPSVELREGDRITTVEPFDRVAADELTGWLRAAVTQLPDQQATVFVMAHFEQLSREEFCSMLDISPEAVSTTLYKARQSLLAQLNLHNLGESK